MLKPLLLIALAATLPLFADAPYFVQFIGKLSEETVEVLKSQSQLLSLESSPPPSLVSLKRRALADLPNLTQALHSQGFFNAEIDLEVNEETSPVTVLVNIETGPIFQLASFTILPSAQMELSNKPSPDRDKGRAFLESDFLGEEEPFSWEVEEERVEWVDLDSEEHELSAIPLEKLGVTIGGVALPSAILKAEESLIEFLHSKGYPLAKVSQRTVVADRSRHNVEVTLYVDTGPLAHLNFPSISGYSQVERDYITRKVTWSRSDLYSPEKIASTFDALERSGLFRSITVELAEELDEEGLLPVDIHVIERKHRSVGIGVNYSTEWGAGVVGEWQHRNMRGVGEQLAFKTELLSRYQTGTINYRIPDFYFAGMDLLNSVNGEREITDSYHETSWTLSSRLYKRLTPSLQGWAGVALMYTYATHSDNDHHFTLLKVPLQMKYNTSDNILDPSRGININLRFTPTSQLLQSSLNYYTTRYDGAVYLPMNTKETWIFAGRVSLGTILGASRIDIPPAERFYAGSPNLLRGYRYLTVSPLDAQNSPEGGRSLMVISLEARRRINEEWGLVGFFDIGNVYSTPVPELSAKQLKSIGVGMRYYTPVGPLRLDLAFPLNPRASIDPSFQIYFSIGQTY